MIPISLIASAVFILLLIPEGNSKGILIKKENEGLNHTSTSINLHLSTCNKNQVKTNSAIKKVHKTIVKVSLELVPEQFSETSLQMEGWINSLKNTDK